MVAEMSAHEDDAPCFVFEDVPGTLKGSRMLVNFFARQAQEHDAGVSHRPLQARTERRLSRPSRVADADERIPPKFVDSGPVMQNVMTGDAIDVTKFPAPKWHPKDGGRYIGTGCYNVMRDPDDGWINCGTYRVMIHDEKSLGFYISPGKHGRQMRDKYQARGERMPVVHRVRRRSDDVPDGLERSAVRRQRARGDRRHARHAVEVIKGPVTGLPIPANAEIVIEGFVEPDNVRKRRPVRRMDRLLRQR